MALAQSLGIISLVWGGTKLNVDTKSSSFSRGGLISTPVIAGQQVSMSQAYVPPNVKASLPLTKGMSLDALVALNGQELQVQCDSGQTYTINGATLVKDLMTKGGAGSNVSAEWSGDAALEALS
jgi:hypothetical protein